MKEAVGSWKAHSILLQVFKKTDKCHRENERKAGEAIRSIVEASQRQNMGILILLGPAVD